MSKKQKNKTFPYLFGGAILLLGVAYLLSNAITSKLQASPIVSTTVPDLGKPFAEGKSLYEASCAQCHGTGLGGVKGAGPPFIHGYYNSGHHSDVAFYRAIESGVTAHHWKFGNMPAQSQLDKVQASQIIAYIRAVQKANGIN